MTYLIYCTFDLKNASSNDYQNAYQDLKSIGLDRVVVGGGGATVVIPTTSVMGQFNAAGAAVAADDIRNKVHAAFSARGFKSEIFVISAGDWAWRSIST